MVLLMRQGTEAYLGFFLQSRWFVLEGPVLTKYYSKDTTDATWRVLLSGAIIKENEKKHEFVITADKKIALVALDKGDFAAWSVAFKRAVQLKAPAEFSSKVLLPLFPSVSTRIC